MNKKIQLVAEFPNVEEKDLKLLGNNMINLHAAYQLGLNIPQGFVITSYAYFKFLRNNNLVSKITDLLTTVHYDRPDSIMQVSNHIIKLIADSKLPKELLVELSDHYKNTGGFLKKIELKVGHEYANIDDKEKITNVLKNIWSNQFEPKSLLFFHHHSKNLFKEGVPIYIQQKINFNKIGHIQTSDFSLHSKTSIGKNIKEELILISKKIKNHFYFPQIIEWAVEKKKICITGIKPLTDVS